ncbi:MAG: hypothetical protein R3F24_00150 [Gammaproteobacteria bacterium]
MAAPKTPGTSGPAINPDSEVDFAGYDPYIVAITGREPVENLHDSARSLDEAEGSRKVQLMAWLHQHEI